MNIIKIILYPSPLAPFFGNEEDLKLRCKLEWPKETIASLFDRKKLLEEGTKRGTCHSSWKWPQVGIDSIKVEMGNPCLAHEEILQVMHGD